jgi:tetratricopeptide (TPR) repeat protein
MDARRVFEAVFEAHPLEWPAFDALSRIARATNDEHLAAWLVDRTLSVAADVAVPHAEAALGLMMKFESEGPARDARVHALASALAAREERADWAHLLLARATLAAGDQERAAQLFERVHREATTAGVAAEAAREVLEATDPDAASEVRSVLRSAQSAPVSALGSVLTHARRLATTQDVWPAHLAVAVAARRLGAWDTAKDAHARLARLIPDHPALNDEAIALREALSGEGSQGGPLVGVTTPPRPGASRRK